MALFTAYDKQSCGQRDGGGVLEKGSLEPGVSLGVACIVGCGCIDGPQQDSKEDHREPDLKGQKTGYWVLGAGHFIFMEYSIYHRI